MNYKRSTNCNHRPVSVDDIGYVTEYYVLFAKYQAGVVKNGSAFFYL